ncbi:BnaC02g22480D [Brassica napus]|uniref:BnaC02g22480D protein n=1 Tax=Brassica napus TaxID=3708 RepID=A0A078I6X5_BRANA|nr:BnaC02g22480D [Brassica napus]
MLTGAITIFLFRSIQRRAKRSKEMTFRSSGVKKSLKDEAVEKLKAMGSALIEEGGGKSTTPSAAQAFLGAVSAGVIAVILYKFTTTIEAGLNRQTISDNFSVSFLLFSLASKVDL